MLRDGKHVGGGQALEAPDDQLVVRIKGPSQLTGVCHICPIDVGEEAFLKGHLHKSTWTNAGAEDTDMDALEKEGGVFLVRGGGGGEYSEWLPFVACAAASMRIHVPGAHPAHPNQCSRHLSHCFTAEHPSLLQPRLPNPCRLRGPRVGGMATSPLPSQGSPTRGQTMGKKGDNWENRGKLYPVHPARQPTIDEDCLGTM